MATRNRRPPRGAVLWGVVKWIPFLAIPFSVFFLEVRWQHEIFANDYETNRLSKELRDIERQIAEHEDEEARLKTMELMETMAMELNLVEPAPRQVETIYVSGGLGELAQPTQIPVLESSADDAFSEGPVIAGSQGRGEDATVP